MPARDPRPQVNIRLSVEQRDALLARAEAEGSSATAIVERAIEQYLARAAKETPEDRRMARLGRKVTALVREHK